MNHRAARLLIHSLTPRLRRTCALAWLDRWPAARIASVQGIGSRAVEKRLERARARLRAAGIEPPDRRGRGRRARAFQLGGIENV